MFLLPGVIRLPGMHIADLNIIHDIYHMLGTALDFVLILVA